MKYEKYESKLYKDLLKEGKDYIESIMEKAKLLGISKKKYEEIVKEANLRAEEYYNSVVKKYAYLDVRAFDPITKETYEDALYNIFDNIYLPYLRTLAELMLLKIRGDLYQKEVNAFQRKFNGELRDRISEITEIFDYCGFIKLLAKEGENEKESLIKACKDFNYILEDGKDFEGQNAKMKEIFENVYEDYLKYQKKQNALLAKKKVVKK